MANAAPAHISMAFGYRGPFFASASACASANDAICTAYNAIAWSADNPSAVLKAVLAIADEVLPTPVD